jgi:hypothetical protein
MLVAQILLPYDILMNVLKWLNLVVCQVVLTNFVNYADIYADSRPG